MAGTSCPAWSPLTPDVLPVRTPGDGLRRRGILMGIAPGLAAADRQ